MTKYASQEKLVIKKKKNTKVKVTFLFFGFEHVYLKVDVKTLMFKNYLGFVGQGFCLKYKLLGFGIFYGLGA